ncbi:carbohydrate-binding family 9-like protein [Photobacterium aquimaris]|uniref:Endoxylanase n=1 Tax=Photobacterium aquimaris TaxID=512643 RepID=A0A2T3I3A3_9GAMM|nr:carbohydrate-binding family 9-like protein [Photobacterium aquimaris]OBU22114.1 endoxylanase [Photobacterium aquimaris]PQJ38313.1 endoxylanase [Photobacterium aquimaris]PSU12914.1 endoxylanase [Photobacterium aquimaris]
MNKSVIIAAAVTMSMVSYHVVAETTASIATVYNINHAKIAPVIDGIAQDNEWKSAQALTDFTFPWRDTPAPATEFKAVWHADSLYFQYTVTDANVAIGTDPERAILDSDRVEIFLAKDVQLSRYYTMEIDPKARVFSAEASYDMINQKRASLDSNWTWKGLEIKASLTDSGYVVEGKLPLQTLTDLSLWQNKQQTQLLCALMRAEFTQQADGKLDMGWMTWIDPKTPQPNFHNPQTFGQCQLVK